MSAKEVTGRIIRLASLFQQAYGDAFEPLAVSSGDYGVLAPPLRRTGEPVSRTSSHPTERAKQRMMTSGGMTAAIDRLERKGFVSRVPNPVDRRGSLVRLTDAGRDVMNVAMEHHALVESQLLASLDESERAQLRNLLRKLLRAVDPD